MPAWRPSNAVEKQRIEENGGEIHTEATGSRVYPKGSMVVPFWDYVIYRHRILNMSPNKEPLWSLYR